MFFYDRDTALWHSIDGFKISFVPCVFLILSPPSLPPSLSAPRSYLELLANVTNTPRLVRVKHTTHRDAPVLL